MPGPGHAVYKILLHFYGVSAIPSDGRWLVLVIKLAAEPSRHRVTVWRELRKIGALSLWQGVWAVPDVPVFADGIARAIELTGAAEGQAVTLGLQRAFLPRPARDTRGRPMTQATDVKAQAAPARQMWPLYAAGFATAFGAHGIAANLGGFSQDAVTSLPVATESGSDTGVLTALFAARRSCGLFATAAVIGASLNSGDGSPLPTASPTPTTVASVPADETRTARVKGRVGTGLCQVRGASGLRYDSIWRLPPCSAQPSGVA
ncbi:hypothetical protein JIX56_03325 [Streptomyces sp. CA-210063]|uniref:Chromate resistance protein ChrB n=1 Tax=Streptomyces sp. CA-210063 TaxID=2801029 RepID=UPI00214BF8D7|nr:Chromate resistance protein ChrB [Streptomyces sp. CA-210063]UUU29005.1 hypothetical protein JIX56_03325 [Streptomyces sp. CA-210063]